MKFPGIRCRFRRAKATGIAWALAAAAATIAPVSGAEPPLAIAPSGPPETVFQWATQACEETHVPDIPARAFRDFAGRIHLSAGNQYGRWMVGPDLDHVTVDCRLVYEGGHEDAPGAFDDRMWLIAPYTIDGRHVDALVHSEYKGHLRPDLCPAAVHDACWTAYVTYAVSDDGGYSYRRPAPPGHLVATVPYVYDGRVGRRYGIVMPSNILRRGAYYYATVYAPPFKAQRRGACLLRTATPGDPASWRAWDGHDFTVRFIDPYRETGAEPERHVCAPIAPEIFRSTIYAILRHEKSGAYIAIFTGGHVQRRPDDPPRGVYAALSRNLIDWSAPVLVWETPTIHNYECGTRAPIAYPSLLDPDSKSRNFETVDDDAYIYFTRFNDPPRRPKSDSGRRAALARKCNLGMDRDLVRLPVHLRVAPGR